MSVGVATLGCVDDEWWPEDEEDGEPLRPSAAPRPTGVPVAPDYRPQPARSAAERAADREELAREIARREDGAFEEQIDQIYAPTPVEGRTAVAGVPVALPPPPPRREPPAAKREPAAKPDEERHNHHPSQFEYVQPGQIVSPEWRHEPDEPRDLPQAPQSAWAQPPTAAQSVIAARTPAEPPVVKPPALKPPAQTQAPAPRAPGEAIPHQVPPAPMPRPAEELARRRIERRPEPPAEMGLQGALRRSTFGLISPAPGRREAELNADLETVRRRFGGLRQITVANPVPGTGKTVAMLMLGLTFGQHRGGSVAAWDAVGVHRGLLGFKVRTDQELLTRAELPPAEADCDLLSESTVDFGTVRDALERFYNVVVVRTGPDPRAAAWRDAIDATDQLVVPLAARDEHADGAVGMLDYLERNGRVRSARQAVTILTVLPNQREADIATYERYFAARTRAVVRVPVDRAIEGADFRRVSDASRLAWLRAAAAIAEAL